MGFNSGFKGLIKLSWKFRRSGSNVSRIFDLWTRSKWDCFILLSCLTCALIKYTAWR